MSQRDRLAQLREQRAYVGANSFEAGAREELARLDAEIAKLERLLGVEKRSA